MTANLARNPVVRGTPAWAASRTVKASASNGFSEERPR